MNMFEEARALDGTIRLCKITQEELAGRLGVSQSYIANKLRLLKYSDEMQTMILDCGISERHARSLLRLPDDRARKMALRRVQKEELSVSMTEQLVDMLLTTDEVRSRDGVCEKTVTHLQRILVDAIGILSSVGIRARRTTEESATEIKVVLSITK